MQAEAQAEAYTESLAAGDLQIAGLRSADNERAQVIKTLEVREIQHAVGLQPLLTKIQWLNT